MWRGQVRPSVLHGDLWSGNIGSVGGEPSIFDPAVYYGHSEAEFGMAWCAALAEILGPSAMMKVSTFGGS